MLLAFRNITPKLKMKKQPPSVLLCWVMISFHYRKSDILVFTEVKDQFCLQICSLPLCLLEACVWKKPLAMGLIPQQSSIPQKAQLLGPVFPQLWYPRGERRAPSCRQGEGERLPVPGQSCGQDATPLPTSDSPASGTQCWTWQRCLASTRLNNRIA